MSKNVLLVYTIYDHAPTYWVQCASVSAKGVERLETIGLFDSLEEARKPMMERGLVRLDPLPEDGKDVLENWL